jgi:hypothetical protein
LRRNAEHRLGSGWLRIFHEECDSEFSDKVGIVNEKSTSAPCSTCTQLNFEIKAAGCDTVRREKACAQKKLHRDDVISQRRVASEIESRGALGKLAVMDCDGMTKMQKTEIPFSRRSRSSPLLPWSLSGT